MTKIYIGLGSNLGRRKINLQNATKCIAARDITITEKSSILETTPVDLVEQPLFLNQIITIETDLQPIPLLTLLKEIEIKMGRKPSVPKGPRLIDIDILLYGSCVYHSEGLIIPHPAITKRIFILKHLVELEPGLVHPVTGEKFIDILKKMFLQYPDKPSG